MADFALLRAAELTINNGYNYLIINSYLNKYIEDYVYFRQPVLVRETHTVKSDYNQNALMQDKHNYYQKNTYSTSNWEQGSQKITFKVPTSEIHINFVNEHHESDSNVKNAKEIIKQITKKYQLKLDLKNNLNSI